MKIRIGCHVKFRSCGKLVSGRLVRYVTADKSLSGVEDADGHEWFALTDQLQLCSNMPKDNPNAAFIRSSPV